MTPRQIVVTGASRGLGAEFVRQWLASGAHVFALGRWSPAAKDQDQDQDELRQQHPESLHLATCDVGSDDSVAAAARTVASEWKSVDVLVNNAGVFGQQDPAIEQIEFADVCDVYNINAVGPLRVAQALLPLLLRGNAPRIINVTSRMGSLADNTSGGYWAYRMSKAALNMAAVNLAHEGRKRGFLSVVIHPGWVRTRMGGSSAPLATDAAVAAMIASIDRLGPAQQGAFLDLHGEPVPW